MWYAYNLRYAHKLRCAHTLIAVPTYTNRNTHIKKSLFLSVLCEKPLCEKQNKKTSLRETNQKASQRETTTAICSNTLSDLPAAGTSY